MICVRCVVCLCLSVRLVVQSQIQDFPKGEAPFVCQVDAIQWGGGSSRIFPWSPKADAPRISGGGG